MILRLLLHQKISHQRCLSTLPNTVDTIVVGGGIIGCASALALSKEKQHNVLVLEQNMITSGTTWHAAGLVTQVKGHEAMVEMAKYGVQTFTETKDSLELSGFQHTGSLGLARTPDKWQELLRATHRLTNANVPFTTYGPGGNHSLESCQSLHPLLDFKASTGETNNLPVIGALHTPTDGIVNPADACQMLVKAARKNGVQFSERTRVVQLLYETLRDECTNVIGVLVENHKGEQFEIQCSNILLTCGQWTTPLIQSLPVGPPSFFPTNQPVPIGISVPTAIVPHQYAIFDHLGFYENTDDDDKNEMVPKVTNKLPVVRDYDNHYYLKPEVGGLMVGEFESPHVGMPQHVALRNENPTTIPHDAENELYEENYDKGTNSFEAALKLCPELNNVGIKTFVHGPDTHSVDHEPLMGRCAFTKNVYVATGFNSQGIQLGPGVGQAMSDWIVHDNPGKSLNGADFAELDCRRFHPSFTSDREWITTRALQGYADEYSVHYPTKEFVSIHDGKGTGRNVRVSSLHSFFKTRDAVFGSDGRSGWERVLHFGNDEEIHNWHHSKSSWSNDVRNEHNHTRKHCSMFDMSSFGKLSISGKDALRLLEYTTTSMIGNMNVLDTITYTQMLNERGGIESDATIIKTGENNYYLITGAGSAVHDADHLLKHARNLGCKDISIKEVSDTMAVLAVAGPKSRQILGKIVNDGENSLSNIEFPYGTCRRIKIGNISVLALRVSYVGELGWELHMSVNHSEKVVKLLLECNQNEDLDEKEKDGVNEVLRFGGYRAILNSLRVEKGFVHWGHDVGPEDTPFEAGLSFTCNTKLKSNIPFVGRSVLLNQQKKGTTKRLMSFSVNKGDEDISLWGQEIIYVDNVMVGKLTSGGVGNTCNSGRAIGMGYVHVKEEGTRKKLQDWKDWIQSGTRTFEIEIAGRRISVTPKLTALHDSKGDNMKV